MGRAYLFCCPTTGQNVQGYSEQDPPEAGAPPVYEGVTCLACGSLHIVDPATGRLLRDDASDARSR
jgi:hypothetical protein